MLFCLKECRVPDDPISLKSELLFGLRDTLRSEGFVELTTPVARRADLGPGGARRSTWTAAATCGP